MTSLRVLSDIALNIINQKSDFSTRIREVIRLIGEHLNVSRVYIFIDNKDGNTTSNVFEWCNNNIKPQIDELQEIPYSLIPSWKPMLKKKGLIFSENISNLPEDLVDLLEPQEIKSLLVYPLHIDRNLRGFIGFDENSMNRHWSDEDQELLKTISGIIANAYTLKFRDDELKQYSEMLEQSVSERTKALEESLKKLSMAQNKLFEQEKLASIGLLAAGVAHEINNPTGYLISNTQTLSEYLSIFNTLFDLYEQSEKENRLEILERIKSIKDEENFIFIREDIKNLLNDSIKGAQRISNIVKGLQTFAQKDDGHQSELQLSTVIEGSLNVLCNKMKYHCTISKKLNRVPGILGSARQLEQVIVNILLNAVEAIDDEGKISIELYSRNKRKEVVLEIKDSGSGIETHNLKRIFEPFFTTRDVNQGTGLGLAIAHGIIQNHKGKIEVESEKGKGSLFRLQFPALLTETNHSR